MMRSAAAITVAFAWASSTRARCGSAACACTLRPTASSSSGVKPSMQLSPALAARKRSSSRLSMLCGSRANARSDGEAERFEIAPRDRARFLRRALRVRHTIQLDDGPARKLDVRQRSEERAEINVSSTQLDEAVRLRCAAGRGTLDILHVQKEQPISVLPDCRCRITAGLTVMRGVELELHEHRVGSVEYARDLSG